MRILVIFRGDLGHPTGATIRARMEIEALCACGDVDLVTLEAEGFAAGDLGRERTGPVRRHVRLERRSRRITPADSVRWLVRRKVPRRLLAADSAAERAAVLAATDGQYDLAYAIVDRAALAVPTGLARRVIVDLIDFEPPRDRALAWRAARLPGPLGERLGSLGRALGAAVDEHCLRRLIDDLHSGGGDVVVSSAADRSGAKRPWIRVIDNAYLTPDPPLGRPEPDPERPTFLFVGFFPYLPNADGAEWFAREVLPIVREGIPGASVRLVGARAEAVDALAGLPGVDVVGPVPSLDAELAAADAVVVPLRHGSGTRVKILEAWAHRIPVVATTVGAAGLGVVDGREALVADDPAGFAAACRRVVEHPDLRHELVTRAAERFEQGFSESSMTASIRALVGVDR